MTAKPRLAFTDKEAATARTAAQLVAKEQRAPKQPAADPADLNWAGGPVGGRSNASPDGWGTGRD